MDRDFWRINWVRGSVTAQLPWKWKGDKIAKELGVISEKLEEAIGGKVKRTWPVIHLLATRKWIYQLRHKTATRFDLPSVDRFCQYPRFSFAVCTPNPSTHLHQPSPSTRHQPSPPQGSQIGLFPSTTTIVVTVERLERQVQYAASQSLPPSNLTAASEVPFSPVPSLCTMLAAPPRTR